MGLIVQLIVSIVGMLIELFVPNSVEVAREASDKNAPSSDVYARPSRLRQLCFPPIEDK